MKISLLPQYTAPLVAEQFNPQGTGIGSPPTPFLPPPSTYDQATANKLRRELRTHRPSGLPDHASNFPLVPYLLSARNGKQQILVAIDSEFSDVRDALLTARQITLAALQSRLAKSAFLAPTRPGSSVLAQFVSGQMSNAYLDSADFAQYCQSKGLSPEARTIHLDTKRKQLVIDLQRAFKDGDHLSDSAMRTLSQELRIRQSELSEAGPVSSLPQQRLRQDMGKADIHSGAMPQQRPIRRRGALFLEYGYTGKEIRSKTKGADFYRPNRHPGIKDLQSWVELNRHSYTHLNHFAPQYLEHAPHKEIIVHRGLIDNRQGIPENSLAAIDNAFQHGYYSVEIDVQVTLDDQAVLMHDFTAGRMTADIDNRLVSQISAEEITRRNLVIRNPATGDYVKTDQKVVAVKQALAHVMEKCQGMTVYLDCKESTPEATISLLLDHPEFNPMTAIKLYGRTYLAGFPQLLSRMQERYNIDPFDPAQKEQRQVLRDKLAQIKMVPILSQGFLDHEELFKYFGPRDRANPNEIKPTAEEMAAVGMNWLRSWDKNTTPVLLEVVQVDNQSASGRAMGLIRERLREEGSSLANLPFSGSYRYEDFSVKQKDHSTKYYTWDVHGGIVDVTTGDAAIRRGTAGAFRNEADSLLTDQPDEEILALSQDRTLARGHSGYELDLPPSTEIPLNRDLENRRARLSQFLKAKPGIDPDGLAATLRGMEQDKHGI